MINQICPNCPHCGSSNVRLENVDGYTDLACGDCGYVLEEDYFRNAQFEQESNQECKLCNGVIEKAGPYRLLGEYIFHVDCYETVLKRLDTFWEVLTLPNEQWQDWIDDDNQ